ncbi:MAG: hypothetical protein QM602_06820, partial [Microbacterium sp.]
DEAFAAAEKTYRAYVEALNEVDLSDPATFEPVFALTTGIVNTNERKTLSEMHADGWVVSGESAVALLEGQTFDSSDWTTQLAICLDVAGVDVVDSTGASVVDEHRVDIQSLLVTTTPSSSTSTGMAISSIDGREGEPSC